jgi:hypothetical protein
MGALPTIFLFNSAASQRAATKIVSGAEAATGEPLYANVPTPGKELSDEPAIEAPATAKASASMKLRVRILTVSGFGRRRRPPFSSAVVNQRLFPDVCAKAQNGFIPREYCFVARARRNNSLKISMISVECCRSNRAC